MKPEPVKPQPVKPQRVKPERVKQLPVARGAARSAPQPERIPST